MASDVVMEPVHPGEILNEEFLAPLNPSQYQLAKQISVPPRRINEIVHGQRRAWRHLTTSGRWELRSEGLAPN